MGALGKDGQIRTVYSSVVYPLSSWGHVAALVQARTGQKKAIVSEESTVEGTVDRKGFIL